MVVAFRYGFTEPVYGCLRHRSGSLSIGLTLLLLPLPFLLQLLPLLLQPLPLLLQLLLLLLLLLPALARLSEQILPFVG